MTPTLAPMPDPAQVADFSAAISGLLATALLIIAGLAWRRGTAWFQQIIEDVRVTRTQTTNKHTTNLRDDVTCIQGKVEDVVKAIDETNKVVAAVAESVSIVAESSKATQEDVRELRKDVRFAMEYARDATEYVREVDRRVAAARRQP